MKTAFLPYHEWAEQHFAEALDADAITMAGDIIEALEAGTPLPEDFEELDTYAAIGEPGAVAHIARIRQCIRDYCKDARVRLPVTGTILDRRNK